MSRTLEQHDQYHISMSSTIFTPAQRQVIIDRKTSVRLLFCLPLIFLPYILKQSLLKILCVSSKLLCRGRDSTFVERLVIPRFVMLTCHDIILCFAVKIKLESVGSPGQIMMKSYDGRHYICVDHLGTVVAKVSNISFLFSLSNHSSADVQRLGRRIALIYTLRVDLFGVLYLSTRC